MTKQPITCKVLPFDTPRQGRCTGHEIMQHCYDWLGEPIEYVVFEDYDLEARMPVQHLIHWTQFTQYVHSKWPAGGTVHAVMLRSGRRVYAKSWSVRYYDDKAYLAAPVYCRDAFKITTLDGGYALMEVVGVREWSVSARDAEALAKVSACPWERDNKAAEDARMAAQRAQADPEVECRWPDTCTLTKDKRAGCEFCNKAEEPA